MLAAGLIALVNLRLAYERPGAAWEVALAGTNVTDASSPAGSRRFASFGTVAGSYNRPREWAAVVRKSFR